MSTNRRTLAAIAAAALVSACAPDEFKPSPGFDGFLDRVGRECYPDTIGSILVRQWAQGYGPGGGSGAGFIDATSSLYFGKWTSLQYRQFVTAMKEFLPNARFSMDISPWVGANGTSGTRAAGWAIVAACMTRYEAWPVCGALIALAWLALLWRGVPVRASLRRINRLATYPAIALVLFSANSRWTTGTWSGSSPIAPC